MPNYTLDELLKMMEPQSRRDKALINDCIDGLGLYAAQQARENSNSPKVDGTRNLVENLVGYWGLDNGENAKPLEDYMQSFDFLIDSAKSGAVITADTYQSCADVLNGLYRHGQDLIVSLGKDAMSEILETSDLMEEIAQYYGYETDTLYDMTAELESEVRTMLDGITLPGQPESGEDVHGYKVRQAIAFNNDRGIAFAENPGAPSPFVTWQFTDEGGSRDFYWGHYFGSEERALVDYISRVSDYMGNNKVTEKPIPQTVEIGDSQPLVTVTFSEHEQLRSIEKMPLYLANTLFFEADEKQSADYVKSKYTIPHLKTEFHIEYVRDGKPETYSGQYDIGTGDETLTEHIEDYAEYYKEYPENQEYFEYRGGEKITGDAQFDIILDELVPFFDKHCELSRRESDALSELMEIHDAAEGSPSDSAKVRIEYLETTLENIGRSRAVLNGTDKKPSLELSQAAAGKAFDGMFGIESAEWTEPAQSTAIEVFIVNRERQEKSENIGEWLKLPSDADTLRGLLERIGVDRPSDGAFAVTAVRVSYEWMRDYVSKYDSLDELNMLASYMSGMEDYEIDKLQAILTSGVTDIGRGTAALINLLDADNFDAVELIDAKNAYELGEYYILDVPYEMNFSEYGNKLAREEKGVFTEVGYLYNKYEQEPEYTGVVPDEYKIVGKAIQDLHPKTPARDKLDEKLSVIEQIRASRQAQREPKESQSKNHKKTEKGGPEL